MTYLHTTLLNNSEIVPNLRLLQYTKLPSRLAQQQHTLFMLSKFDPKTYSFECFRSYPQLFRTQTTIKQYVD